MLFPLYTNDFVWGLFSQMIFLLFIVCLLVTSIGFYKLVFFISVGYGYSIFGMAIISLLLSRGIGSWTTWIHAILLGIYGLRLGTFVAIREGKATYQTCRANDGDRTGEARLSVQLAIWVSVSVLYVALFEPAAARFEAEARGVVDGKNLLSCAGLAVIAGGLVVESVADHQKAAAKAIAPGRFCDKVRHCRRTLICSSCLPNLYHPLSSTRRIPTHTSSPYIPSPAVSIFEVTW